MSVSLVTLGCRLNLVESEAMKNAALGAGTAAATQYIGQKIATWAGNRATQRTANAEARASESTL